MTEISLHSQYQSRRVFRDSCQWPEAKTGTRFGAGRIRHADATAGTGADQYACSRAGRTAVRTAE